jgi:Flp pilus assembly protein TadG
VPGVGTAGDHHEDALKPNRKRSSARRHRSRGQSMVEFALVFPLFILLLAGMVDFGIGLYSYMTLVNATREGARLGATNCSVLTCTNAVKARVTAASRGLAQPGDVTVICTKAAGGVIPTCTKNTAIPPAAQNGVKNGDSVTVTSSYDYHMIWPLTFGTVIPMSSTVTYMAE